jgi:hypothetical protein
MQMKSVMKNIAGVFGVMLLVGFLNGCTSGIFGGTDSSVQPPADDGLASVSTMVAGYGDIELPIEMTLSPEKSIALRTDSFQGGIHSYSGRVQIGSLKDYILASMRNNKWKLVGEASYKNVMMAFTKPNKTCMVVLTEGLGGGFGKTEAVFYVTIDVAASNRLTPFGTQAN